MNKKGKKNELFNRVKVAVIIALLVGGSSPWWWKEFKNYFIPEDKAVRTELRMEGVERVKSFRQQFELCDISLKFSVADKIDLVNSFKEELSVLDKYVNPKYDKYKFMSIVSELKTLSEVSKQDTLSFVTNAFELLPQETDLLLRYLNLYRSTPNDQGGAEYLHKSEQQLGRIMELLEKLRIPWSEEIEPFPNCTF